MNDLQFTLIVCMAAIVALLALLWLGEEVSGIIRDVRDARRARTQQAEPAPTVPSWRQCARQDCGSEEFGRINGVPLCTPHYVEVMRRRPFDQDRAS